MSWFRHLTIGQKLLVSFGSLLLVLVVSLAAILFYLARINSYVERQERITVPALVTTAYTRKRIFEMTLLLHGLTDTHSGNEHRQVVDRVNALESEARNLLSFYRANHTAKTHPVLFQMLVQHGRASLADQEDRALVDAMELLDAYETRKNTLVASLTRNDKKQADLALREIDMVTHRLIDKLATLIESYAQITTEMKSEGDSLFRHAILAILLLIVLLGLLTVATYVIVSTQVAGPLERLAETAERVAHHELSAGFEPWPARDEVGKLARTLATMLDNLRVRTRSLERKTRELEAFTYSVAHDLKGPLREIEGFSSLIQTKLSDTLDQASRHYVSKIRASALRLTALINDLLRYSRLEQQALPASQVNVRALIDQIVADRFPSKHSPCLFNVNLPFTHIGGEPTSIQQVFINLIDNAIKFSAHADPPEISIGGRVEANERIIWIRDNGIGFDPKHVDKLFGLFERLHSPEEYEGTGVGLAIVKLVMDKHGGRVWAESCPDKGSVFYLAFPETSASQGVPA